MNATAMATTFLVKPTSNTPYVTLDHQRKRLIIKGRSFPIASVEFYDQITNAVREYLGSNELLSVYIALEYFNTSSSKCIYRLLKDLKKYQTSENKRVKIHWYYEIDDEDMKETGEDYMKTLDFEFNMKSYTY